MFGLKSKTQLHFITTDHAFATSPVDQPPARVAPDASVHRLNSLVFKRQLRCFPLGVSTRQLPDRLRPARLEHSRRLAIKPVELGDVDGFHR